MKLFGHMPSKTGGLKAKIFVNLDVIKRKVLPATEHTFHRLRCNKCQGAPSSLYTSSIPKNTFMYLIEGRGSPRWEGDQPLLIEWLKLVTATGGVEFESGMLDKREGKAFRHPLL